ncbi:MAG: hypothetical protein ACE1ZA_15965 [Pseudomonadales bacterium]
MLFNIAQLDVGTLKSIQSLEQEIGQTLVAFTGIEATPAQVSEADLTLIQALESELEVTLVAVES